MSAKSQTDAPPKGRQSGFPAALLPAAIKRMVDLCVKADAFTSTNVLVGRLLSELTSAETGTRAGLRLNEKEGVRYYFATDDEGVVEEEQTPERMFPALAQEHIAALPGDRGTLHLASLSADAQSGQVLELQLSRVGAIVTLAIDAANANHQAATLRQELWQMQKLATIGQSAASVVHELNNPLTTIIAYSDFLIRRCEQGSGDDTMVERLARIHEAAARIQQFSRQLIDYSRPTSSLSGPIDVHTVIDRALGFCMHLLRSSDIVVERSYRDVPIIDGMETPLTQVFVNLITNAWHAMQDSPGTLRLATQLRDKTIIIEVNDEGHGIPSDHISQLFDAYFTTKTKTTGVGLGLHIVQQIVADHGGTITASNRDPRGAVFTIELPLGR